MYADDLSVGFVYAYTYISFQNEFEKKYLQKRLKAVNI